MARKNKSNEIRIIRKYDAPIEAVWDAWTDPEKVAKWWGPRGFTLTTHRKDLRSGGSWCYTMHGPDGVDYLNTTLYLEVEPLKRLVYDHGGHEDRPPLFRVTVNFKEIQGKTLMEMSMTLPTPEAAEETKKFIKKANGYSTWDRLAEYLDKELFGKDRFIINRSFDVSIQKMFEMWTKPEHFSKWLAPTGFDMKFIRPDIRPGGTSFYVMSGAENIMMYGRAKYLEIISPVRIVYTQQFCDENEGISRHPKAPTWPETMLTTVTLTEESPDQTRVTVEWETYGNVTQEELEAFIKAKMSMMQGWTGSFDKLDSYLMESL